MSTGVNKISPLPKKLASEKYRKATCRYCASPLKDAFLELGTMPLANSYLSPNQVQADEFTCPLSLTYCQLCHLVQLTHVVPPDLMFSNYLYVSSTTKTFQTHFAEYAYNVKQKLEKSGNILAVDIGSNDGLLLKCYKQEGMEAVGIEPAKNLSEAANREGLTTLNRYFDAECVERIKKEYGTADIVSANNVFAHIDNVGAVCHNVGKLLSEKGIFVVEFPYLVTMVEEMLFDMIYHEHLSYISVTAVNYLIAKCGLELFDIERVSPHGGSLRVFIQKRGGGREISKRVSTLLGEEIRKGYDRKATYSAFGNRVAETKKQLIKTIKEIKSKGKSISGYGAPAKASTIINCCGLNREQIDYIVDDNPLKQGKLSPGARIPIVSSDHLNQNPTDYVVIFAWNFAQEIIQKVGTLRAKGVKFVIPLPEPKIV